MPLPLDGVQFLFFDVSEAIVEEWNRAFTEHVSEKVRSQIGTLNCELDRLPEEHDKFDCIVSPANSYGRLDGR